MATVDLITELNTDLNNAYTAISGKGGTVPSEKNSNNLATAISSITGGGSTPQYPYDIPEFDGGEYGAIAYVDENGEVAYYTATSKSDLRLTTPTIQTSIKVLPNGYIVNSSNLLSYAVGSQLTTLPDTFLNSCYRLQSVYGLAQSNLTSIGVSFLRDCSMFNSPVVLPNSLQSLGGNFMGDCSTFNQPVVLSANLTEIPGGFLVSCSAFNQELTIPEGVSSIGENFLNSCPKFNSSISLPSSLQSIGDSFLYSCYAYNQPLLLATSLSAIPNNFMKNCTSFAQALTLPATVTMVGTYFLSNNFNFTGPLDLQAMAAPSDNFSLSVASSSQYPMYTTGVTLTGPGAQAWKDALADRATTPYRKLIVYTPPSDFNPVDPENVDLDNLSNIVKAGKASEFLAVGDLLSIPLKGGTALQRRVLGFVNRTVMLNGSEQTVPAIRFENANLVGDSIQYSDALLPPLYSTSNLRSYIITTLQEKESEDFLACLGATKTETYIGENDIDVVYDKLYAPSGADLGVPVDGNYYTESQQEVEGPVPAYYQNSNNGLRKKPRPTGSGISWYWTRSKVLTNKLSILEIYDGGVVNTDSNADLSWVAVNFDFIGKY